MQALFVTLLWSSSYVLIDIGLTDIPALTFAGLRYTLAAIVLLPLFFYQATPQRLASLSPRDWGLVVLLGVSMYTITQGAQFLALRHLQSATVSLLLNFTPVIVLGASIPVLGERPTSRQLLGVAILLVGVGLYFRPLQFPASEVFGLTVMGLGVLGNAAAAILGRRFNRGPGLSPLAVTTLTMSIGSVLLLGSGLATQGLPALSLENWLVVGWLAIVNTAFAFTLWNHTLQTLSAVESSIINNTMLIQVAVLGWVLLDESLTVGDGIGLLIVAVGALVVQLGRSRSKRE
ncbi:DMT family transporter [Halomarina rubra]|uniref:DMT family transporter n=1 Tax=Halomarina rubra TaxID=2071873 RepID=A0ABD6AYM2_9EURY